MTLNEIAERHRRWSAEMLRDIELMEAGNLRVRNGPSVDDDITAQVIEDTRRRRDELERIMASYADRLD